MIRLRLKRTFLGENYTIGRLYIKVNNADEYYFCDTLEDVVRELKTIVKLQYLKVLIR